MRAVLFLSVCGVALALSQTAEAKKARCYNSDDGDYACTFTGFGGDGSFKVSAPAKPSYSLVMEGRGVANGFADYGSGNRALPGPFYRSDADRACWVSDATNFTICAY
ncbi:MAG: hypothetical protein ROR55_09590 [Devosia sp.]